jgi:antitoxin component of MazEF toxin-antitoxin module
MKISQKTHAWGNSTGIRLPQKVLRAARWSRGQEVAIDVRGRSVVLTPVNNGQKLPSLHELLHGVTPEAVRDSDVDWGADRGKEAIGD